MKKVFVREICIVIICFIGLYEAGGCFAQNAAVPLFLDSALSAAEHNYPSIQAKLNFAQAARERVKGEKLGYLPTLNLHAQQLYGTDNGLEGSYISAGIVTSSSGGTLLNQNWNAAFTSVYLANFDWDVFSFGHAGQQVDIAQAAYKKALSDLEQEKFELKIKVISAYISVTAAQELILTAQNNVNRATAIKQQAYARTSSGLDAGVDTSFANAELSNARIGLLKAKQTEQEQRNLLALLTGLSLQNALLDSTTLSMLPVPDSLSNLSNTNPVLQPLQERINLSRANEKYLRYSILPKLVLTGSIQARGSGFNNAYGNNNLSDYSNNYLTGITPTRDNYFAGLVTTWNILSIPKIMGLVKSQKKQTDALQSEYDLEQAKLQLESNNAKLQLQTTIAQSAESENQLKAAADAFNQKNTLYHNGLSTLTDFTQAYYNLNRAETDRAIYHASAWQALLQQAAAAGNLSVFLSQYHR